MIVQTKQKQTSNPTPCTCANRNSSKPEVGVVNRHTENSMTSDRQCGFTSLIAMSCKDHVEKFAHTLQTKLRSLGTPPGTTSEASWIKDSSNNQKYNGDSNQITAKCNGNAAKCNGNNQIPQMSTVISHQPQQCGAEAFIKSNYEYDSPGSPIEEVAVEELSKLTVNEKDDLPLLNGDRCGCKIKTDIDSGYCLASPLAVDTPADSDSSDVYYDPELQENELFNAKVNRCASLESNNSFESTCSFDSIDNLRLNKSEQENTNLSQQTSANNRIEFNNIKNSESNNLQNHFSDSAKQILGLDEVDNAVTVALTNGLSKVSHICELEILPTLKVIECPLEVMTATLKISNEETEHNIEVNKINDETTESVDESKKEDESTRSETDEVSSETEERTPRVRRCSSLKTGKTPPGTPGGKKIVRFADALGLDLADVRTFMDEIPKVPTSAYDDLVDVDLSPANSESSIPSARVMPCLGQNRTASKVVVPLFQQPGGDINFLDKVRDRQCCLENVVVDSISISGIVRVRNLDFHKSVYIRYTLDDWRRYSDLQATYISNSCDGFSDKFKFLLYTHTLGVGQRLEFAVKFQCKGVQYWDNNGGTNYCFQCLPASNNTSYVPITAPEEQWGLFNAFY